MKRVPFGSGDSIAAPFKESARVVYSDAPELAAFGNKKKPGRLIWRDPEAVKRATIFLIGTSALL
jgi:hypothetical protein